MSINKNTEIFKKLRNVLKLQQTAEGIPERIGDVILPVVNVNPDRDIKFKTGVAANTVNAVLFVTHATKRTFFVGVQTTLTKDAVSDSTSSSIKIARKGEGLTDVFVSRYQPTTAGNYVNSTILPHPIELEKGSNVEMTNQAATAVIKFGCVVFYYEVEGEE